MYMTEGHNESALSNTFTTALEKENVEYASINLMDYDTIPEDAACLLINGAVSDFSADDKDKVIEYLERGGNSNQGNVGNRGGQSSSGGTRPGSGGGARPGAGTGASGTRPENNNGGGAGRTGSTGTGTNVSVDSILKTFWQKYQQAKRDHENFINGELATMRQKVKDTEAKLVQADNLDKKLGYVQTLQRLLMQEKMQVARAVMLAKMANMYLKQYEDATARFNRKNQQGGR